MANRVGPGRLGRLGFVPIAVGLVGVGTWWATKPPWWGTAGHRTALPEAPELADPASARTWFEVARKAATAPSAGGLSEGVHRAFVCRPTPPDVQCSEGRGPTPEAAVEAAARGRAWAANGVLTVELERAAVPSEWPSGADPHGAGTFGLQVGGAVVLPWEVLTLRLFAAPDDDEPPAWDEQALQDLVSARGGGRLSDGFTALHLISWVQLHPGAEPSRTWRLHGLDAPAVDAASLAVRARLAADHLVAITAADGRIRYRYDPVRDRVGSGQNLLRHAGTVYALLQAHERFGDPETLAAARRAIAYLLTKTRVDERQGPFGGGRARAVVEGKHLKLGGAALALVAIDTFRRVANEPETWRVEADELATFLLSQQHASGEFVYFAPLDPGGAPRDDTSDYYPGEAVLALILHHELEGGQRWLDAAVRGARWLVDVRDAGKSVRTLAADHWFMIAVPHLWSATTDRRWLDRGLELADVVRFQGSMHDGHDRWHPDYLGGFYEPPRSTPASIRAEGLAAVLDACERAQVSCDELEPLLSRTVAHVAWSQVTPADAWWVARPERAVGGVCGGLVDAEQRNDYTQHALSAMLGAERWAREGAPVGAP